MLYGFLENAVRIVQLLWHLGQKELPIPGLEEIFSMIACAKNGPLDSVFFK